MLNELGGDLNEVFYLFNLIIIYFILHVFIYLLVELFVELCDFI